MIPQDFIHQLLEKIDIVDVVERYIPLKKGGQNYLACCPFHQEKTPSFTVSPTKQFFHCFGCGVHGSAIGFVMQHQGLSFTDAVEQLAHSANMTVPKVQSSYAKHTNALPNQYRLLEKVLAHVTQFYQASLQKSAKSIQYLRGRALSDEIIQKFSLGYAPDDARSLLQNYPDEKENLIKAGLLIANEGQDQPYDRFRDRIMFPIRNKKGAIIGFGARTLDPNKEPKYLNSPETALFKKGQELYGLYEARQTIHTVRRVLVVEGYMDVIALSQYGIDYAVATLGTATSSEQLRQLLQYADDIYFCFDGDEAGHKAAQRALENSLPTLKDGKSLFFLFLPAEHDPDSFVRAHSGKLFEKKLLNESVPFSTYMIRLLVSDINTNLPEGRAKLIHRATPWVKQLNGAPLLAHMLKARLAELTNMTFNDFDDLFGEQSALQSRVHHYQLPKVSQRLSVTSIVHKQILTLLMNPSWAQEVVLPDMVEELSAELACFVQLVETILQHDELLSSAYLMERLRGTACEPIMSDALKQIHADDNALMGANEEAKTAFLEGNKKMIDDWLRHTQLKLHVDKLASQPYQVSTAAEKHLLVELLKKS